MAFVKGKSGNPRGRPKKDFNAQAVVARVTRDGALLAEFWRDMVSGKIGDATARDRLEASKLIAERLWGKAAETLKLSGVAGEPVTVEHTIALDLGD